jgi:hypothetical protein
MAHLDHCQALSGRVPRQYQTASLVVGRSSHAWACPVIMKTDPEHIAWTCARCGAVAITAIGDGPPLQPMSLA